MSRPPRRIAQGAVQTRHPPAGCNPELVTLSAGDPVASPALGKVELHVGAVN